MCVHEALTMGVRWGSPIFHKKPNFRSKIDGEITTEAAFLPLRVLFLLDACPKNLGSIGDEKNS